MKNRQNANAILLTILAIALFFSASLIGILGSFGNIISDFLVGFFGYAAYAVIFSTVLVSIVLLFGGQIFIRPRTVLKYLFLLVLLILALHTATSKQFANQGFFTYLMDCFDSAATAGGMLFGIIAYFPMAILTYGGALAIFCLSFVISAFFALTKRVPNINNFRTKKVVYGSKSTATLTEFNPKDESSEEVEGVGSSLFVENIAGQKDSSIFRAKNASTVINYEPIDSIFDSTLSGNGLLEDNIETDDTGDEILPAPVLEADVRQQAYDKLFNFQKTYTPTSESDEPKMDSPIKKYVPRTNNYEGVERTTSYYPEEKKDVPQEKPVEVEEEPERDPIPKLNLTFESNPYAFTNGYFNKNKAPDISNTQPQTNNTQYGAFNGFNQIEEEEDSYGSKLNKVLNALHTNEQYIEDEESYEKMESILPSEGEADNSFEQEFFENSEDAELPQKSASDILFGNPINPFDESTVVEDEESSEMIDKGIDLDKEAEQVIYSSVKPKALAEENKSVESEFIAIEPVKTEPKFEQERQEPKKVSPNRDFSAIENGNFNTVARTAKPKTESKSKVIPGQIELTDDSVVVKRRPYVAPPLSILSPDPMPTDVSLEGQEETKANLEQVLANFKVDGEVTGIVTGPAFTRYEINLKPGVSVKSILRISDDIAIGLGGVKIRIEAPVPGKTCVGIEVPNKARGTVSLRGVIEKSDFFTAKSPMTVCLGRNISGDNITCDLADMPHLLVAGATGSGKSVCLNVVLCSLLYKSSPEDLRLILVDPKRVELNSYNGLPHMLIKEAITEAPKVIRALDWLIAEMDNRYNLFSNSGVNSIKDYNAKVLASGEGKKLPYILIVIDEIGDLMLVAKNDIEDRIQRLAQLARAAGIHMIVATQRPSTDVITGVIKANLPSRIAFAVSSAPDSITILSMGGAEKLLGKGDMLFSSRTAPEPVRIQCAFIPTSEVQSITQFVKEKNDAFFDENIEKAITSVPAETNGGSVGADGGEEVDALFYDILKFAISTGTISVTMLQRKFRLGFSRAARVVDQMYERNFVSKQEGAKPREVLITQEQFDELFGDAVPDEID